MIFAHSRYETSSQVTVKGGRDLERRLVVEAPRFYPTQFTSRKHVVSGEQRLDQISAMYFGDPEMWWVIAAANPEVFFPENLTPGTVLRIPDVPPVL